MSTKRFRLTPQLRSEIVAGIRAGGYPHVAAEAFGVPRDIFDDWLQRGREVGARDPYLLFAGEVRGAFAQARLRAEISVFKDDPKVWLEHGPGRETERQPGWSVAVKPAEAPDQERNILLDAEVMSLFRTLMQVLAPFPEARTQVAQALMKVGVKEPRTAVSGPIGPLTSCAAPIGDLECLP